MSRIRQKRERVGEKTRTHFEDYKRGIQQNPNEKRATEVRRRVGMTVVVVVSALVVIIAAVPVVMVVRHVSE